MANADVDYFNARFDRGGGISSNGNITFGEVPGHYHFRNGSAYSLSAPGSWRQTELHAQSLGGHLVTINDRQENEFVAAIFDDERNPNEEFWIGLNDEIQEGRYEWANGEPVNYTNWRTGSAPANEELDYAAIILDGFGKGKWEDKDTSAKRRGIIEQLYFDYEGSRYLLSNFTSWHGAQNQAERLGGNLVKIDSQDEQDWLVETFGGDELFWIGLTDEPLTFDEREELEFRWIGSTGKTLEYVNWYPGAPVVDDEETEVVEGEYEDYVLMNSGSPGKWDDVYEQIIPGQPLMHSARGIIELELYEPLGPNFESRLYTLKKPRDFTIEVSGGSGVDIFQTKSYADLTEGQVVTGGGGPDVFNVEVQDVETVRGLNFNSGKLRDLAELLVEPDWDVRAQRRAADEVHAAVALGLGFAGVGAGLIPEPVTQGLVGSVVVMGEFANDMVNFNKHYELDLEEWQNDLEDIGDFFEGKGGDDWGDIDLALRRSLVTIKDFHPGIDTIILPRAKDNEEEASKNDDVFYSFDLAQGNSVLVILNPKNSAGSSAIPLLRIEFDPAVVDQLNGLPMGRIEFISSLMSHTATHTVIGRTMNEGVAVTGSDYNGTPAGDYIYVFKDNNAISPIEIFGYQGDDILAGRAWGPNEIYGGEGNDLLFPGSIDDPVDGGSGFDQIHFGALSAGIVLSYTGTGHHTELESFIGTDFADDISFAAISTPPDEGSGYHAGGGLGDDTLTGSVFDDVLEGGEDDDSLIGGEGVDVLYGFASASSTPGCGEAD